ncbi:unnamed protein product, partial [Heterosigma akashiwo]
IIIDFLTLFSTFIHTNHTKMGGTASKAAPRARQPLKKVTQTLAKGADQAFSPVNLPKFQAPVGPLPEMDPALIEAMNRAGPAVKTSEVS